MSDETFADKLAYWRSNGAPGIGGLGRSTRTVEERRADGLHKLTPEHREDNGDLGGWHDDTPAGHRETHILAPAIERSAAMHTPN
jgi:hypothetical protein